MNYNLNFSEPSFTKFLIDPHYNPAPPSLALLVLQTLLTLPLLFGLCSGWSLAFSDTLNIVKCIKDQTSRCDVQFIEIFTLSQAKAKPGVEQRQWTHRRERDVGRGVRGEGSQPPTPRIRSGTSHHCYARRHTSRY